MMFEALRSVEVNGKVFKTGDSIITSVGIIRDLVRIGFVRRMNTLECYNALRKFSKWCDENNVNFYEAHRVILLNEN